MSGERDETLFPAWAEGFWIGARCSYEQRVSDRLLYQAGVNGAMQAFPKLSAEAIKWGIAAAGGLEHE